jgi:putative CocE/NonD family hydrolase
MNAYWNDKRANYENIKVPAYVVADGVTSLHPTGTLAAFRRMASKDKWLRINNSNEWYDQSNPENQKDLLRFLDHFLKGAKNGWEKTPPVRVSLIDAGGTDKDVTFSSWPPEETRYKALYLDATGGSLSEKPVPWAASARYPATTGQSTFTITFDKDTQLTGYMKARLWVEADGADDMDVFVLAEKLDANDNVLVPHADFAQGYFPTVPPPGAQGRLRVSLRELDAKLSTHFEPVQKFRNPQKLRPGEKVPIDIAMQPRAYFFHAGQKLRLTVAGYSIKYTTAGHQVPTLNQGTHVIHTGSKYQSYLQVPVISSKGGEHHDRD